MPAVDPRVPWMLRSCRPVIICLEGFDRVTHGCSKSPDVQLQGNLASVTLARRRYCSPGRGH